MNLNLEQAYLANVAIDSFDPEKVRVTSNKGVMIRADNTYHIMPTQYGYRISVLNNYEGLKEEAAKRAMETSIRGFDGALIVKVDDIKSALKVIEASEKILH